jgi:carbon-monoxide dehydrogenase large subunit
MPYANGLGLIYDSGAYEQVMDAALTLGDWHGFAARRTEARSRGRLRGIGIAGYVEMASGNPRERVEITVRPEGRVEVVIGTLASGQGHETSFAQLLVDWLGVPFDSVQLITGDTDIVPVGGGSHSGRSMRLAGIIMGKASKSIVEQGRRIASCMLEAAETDIEFSAGRFTVKGTDHAVGIFEVATAALERDDVPAELRKALAAECDETVRIPAIPYGCHVCEVEVDPDTGQVEVARYAAVDDVGRAVNPLILHGQAHGSILQGLGQALSERCHYDPGSGQLLSASFLDYALPRAQTMPSCSTEISEVPSPTNPLGVRAGGEGGTAPAPAAAANAVVDALAEFGVRHIELPMTPGRVWRIVNAARGAATG